MRTTSKWACAWMVCGMWMGTSAPGATIWSSGPNDLVFVLSPGSDPTQAASQDRITENVWLTRGSTRGLYNAKLEMLYAKSFSPQGTTWAFSTVGGNPAFTYGSGAAMHGSLTFTNWENALGGPPQLQTNIVTHAGVVHLVADDIYIDIRFDAWATGSGFTYTRAVGGPAGPVNAVWNGGNGNWSAAANWTGGVPNNDVPAGARYTATINTGTATLDLTAAVNALTIGGGTDQWTGKLDLANHALILETTGTADKAVRLGVLQNQVASGRAGGTWMGNGITSSAAAVTPGTAVAIVDNADLDLTTFRGKAVVENSLILVQARLGDANLDGAVDAFDLNLLASHWQQTGGAFWSGGDFNGDQAVDAFDLNLLAGQWQAGTTASLGVVAVPEPAMGGLVLGGVLLLRRRRR